MSEFSLYGSGSTSLGVMMFNLSVSTLYFRTTVGLLMLSFSCGMSHSIAQQVKAIKSPFGPIEHEVKSKFSQIRIRRKGNFRSMMFVRDNGEEVGETVVNIRQPHQLIAPYTQTMFASYLFDQQQKKVLIVGLGGGSMIHFLQKHQPKTIIEVVEIDPQVIQIAEKYFGIKESDHLKIFTKDAFKFFPECKKKYDVIYMDAFLKPSEETDETGVPLNLKTVEFLKSLKQNITDEGLIVFNLNLGSTTKNDIQTLQKVFANCYLFAVPKSESVIVVASDTQERIKSRVLTPVARKLDRQFRANFSFRKMLRNLKR